MGSAAEAALRQNFRRDYRTLEREVAQLRSAQADSGTASNVKSDPETTT